jgi:hypothetical protein
MTTFLDIENSLFGVALLNQSVFLENTTVSADGLYYSKIFQKPSEHSWYQISWLDNSSILSSDYKIELRYRVGNALPYNYGKNREYRLDEFNTLVQTQTPEQIDRILLSATLDRSIIEDGQNMGISPANTFVLEAGDAFNSFVLPDSKQPFWSYWSLPVINSPSFILPNSTYDYIQFRISLQTSVDDQLVNGSSLLAEVYKMKISSILLTN